jgi:hypothetical protein
MTIIHRIGYKQMSISETFCRSGTLKGKIDRVVGSLFPHLYLSTLVSTP